ncbi:hypothetical protein VNI00_001124 [Paramarasmius palmivorus]|uniref:Uncharacterized protein n=1 Tax=Paramarasmius palmivorus TaxID=297713 RepID=A0AAW0E8Y8_9AGAR
MLSAYIIPRVQPPPPLEPQPRPQSLLASSIKRTEARSQLQSPLFSLIPPEIRNAIFALALQCYYDKSVPFHANEYYYRPDYLYRDRIDTALLQTCRQVYLEAYLLPVVGNDHVFWCERGPPSQSPAPGRYFNSMQPEQRSAVDRVHLFTQLYWLEGEFPRLCASAVFNPRYIHITIRHSDWWYWEDNNPLRLKEAWMQSLQNVKELGEFVLELETIERDKKQMYAIAERLAKRQLTAGQRRALKLDNKPPVKGEWMGPASYKSGHTFHPERDRWIQSPTIGVGPYNAMKYCTIKLRWIVA